MTEQFIDHQPEPVRGVPGTAALSAGESHRLRIIALQTKQAEEYDLPPVPADGSLDVIASLRVWLAKDSGHFCVDKTHGTPDDPGYNGQPQASNA